MSMNSECAILYSGEEHPWQFRGREKENCLGPPCSSQGASVAGVEQAWESQKMRLELGQDPDLVGLLEGLCLLSSMW